MALDQILAAVARDYSSDHANLVSTVIHIVNVDTLEVLGV